MQLKNKIHNEFALKTNESFVLIITLNRRHVPKEAALQLTKRFVSVSSTNQTKDNCYWKRNSIFIDFTSNAIYKHCVKPIESVINICMLFKIIYFTFIQIIFNLISILFFLYTIPLLVLNNNNSCN